MKIKFHGMKKLIIVCVLAVLCITGCSRTAALSKAEAEEQVREVWQGYKQMYKQIWGDGLGYKGNITEDMLIKGGTKDDYLCPVEGDITTLAQLKEAVEKVCTSEFADREFYEPYLDGDNKLYEEIDGKLYIYMWANVKYIADIEKCDIIKVEKNKITAEIIGQPDEITGIGYSYDVTLVSENGTWRIDELTEK